MNNMALKRWLVLGGLLALTLYLVWNSPQPSPQLETRLASAPTSNRTAFITNNPAPISHDFRLVPRAQVLDNVVDLFAPPVIKSPPPVTFKPVVKQAAPPPQAPPLPFTFVGKISEAGGTKVFLQANNVVYSLKTGDIFAQQYQLTGVENGKLSLLYLPLNITQTMFYGEAP